MVFSVLLVQKFDLYRQVRCPIKLIVAEQQPASETQAAFLQMRRQGIEQLSALRPDMRVVTILSILNARITLVTETPLPKAALARITLFEATAWLLEKLRAALIALRERGETPAQMAAKPFGLLPSYEGTGHRKARITLRLITQSGSHGAS